MPLSVFIPEGGDVIIGDLVFVVSDIRSRGSQYRLTESSRKTPVLSVAEGQPVSFMAQNYMVTVLSAENPYWSSTKEAFLRIAADRAVTILRGDLYRRNGARFMVSSAVRHAIIEKTISIPDIQTLLHLAATGVPGEGIISNGKYLMILEGVVIAGVAERP